MNRIKPALSVPCLVLAGLALALSVYMWPARPAAATAAPLAWPALQGAAAVEQLKQQGLYDSLNQALTATRYGLKPVPAAQRSARTGDYLADNPAQQLRASFAADGPELQAATPPGQAWRLGIKLRSVGYGAQPSKVGSGTLTAGSNRIEYSRTLATAESASRNPPPTIKEWYNNTPTGLEQGFTLTQPPGERRAGEPLRLALALTGELRARAVADGQAVEFVDAAGRGVLRYDHLAVWDGCGQQLEARMSVKEKELRLEVEDAAAVYPVTIDPNFTQQAYLKASGTGALDFFGASVAVAGDTVVVGAYGESSNATGVNGNQADNSATNAGAAYVFVRSGTTWGQQAYLKASNTGSFDTFGVSVAVAGDTLVVGADSEDSNATGVNGNQADNSASAAGAAYVFVRSGTTWSQQAYLKASNTGAGDFFGYSVAVAGDTVAVGAYGEDSNATGVNGNQADNNATNAGAAYVFVRSGTNWNQQAYLKASNTEANDQFGNAVAVAGDTVVVGANGEDSNATGINGNQSDNSATNAGAAYVFVRSGATWSQQAYLKASNTGANDEFGAYAVAVVGDTVVVGANMEDSNATGINGNQADNSTIDSGAAYIFYTPPIVVTTLADEQNTNGQCSLREALINANNNNQSGSTDCAAGIGVDTISFSVTGTINLSSALPDIAESLTIKGPGANLLTVRRDTGGDYRIFNIPNGGLSIAISGLTISNGKASVGNFGGGISSLSNLALTNCALVNNEAAGFGSGGGVSLRFADGSFTGCTFNGNVALIAGAGIHFLGDSGHTLTLTNCTLSGNMVPTGVGGGIFNASFSGSSILEVSNSTIANNVAAQGGGIFTRTSGAGTTATTRLRSTIVANNSLPNLATDMLNGGGPATVTSRGYNLTSDGGGGFLNGTGDLLNTNPLLAALGNYGGPTQTHALLAGSPALDKGNSAGLATDQRGVGRPVDDPGLPNATGGDGADIGAFERSALAVVSAANFKGAPLAQESIVSAFGENLTTGTAANSGLPLPLTLVNTSVLVRDAANMSRAASLFFVSPGQLNFQIPLGTSIGAATLSIVRDGNLVASTNTTISAVEPALFTANANGAGVPAAILVRVRANGTQVFEPVAQFQGGAFVPVPINLGPVDEQVILVLFGTGIRNRSSLNAVTLTIGNAPAQGVDYAGAQGLVGLDQINSRALPRSLAGAGTVNVQLTVDGKPANVVTLNFQ